MMSAPFRWVYGLKLVIVVAAASLCGSCDRLAGACHGFFPPPPGCLSGLRDPHLLANPLIDPMIDPHGQGSDLLGLGVVRAGLLARVDRFDVDRITDGSGKQIIDVKISDHALTGNPSGNSDIPRE